MMCCWQAEESCKKYGASEVSTILADLSNPKEAQRLGEVQPSTAPKCNQFMKIMENITPMEFAWHCGSSRCALTGITYPKDVLTSCEHRRGNVLITHAILHPIQ